MQEYYKSISDTKRIAFVDNLTDTQAKEVSEKYPFVVCFTSKSPDNEIPVIWYNKRRYGINKISPKTISFNNFSIGIRLNNKGELEIYSANNVDDFALHSVLTYNSGSWFDIDLNDNNVYEIVSLNNQFKVFYKFFKDNNEAIFNDIINFNLNNEIITLKSIENDGYVFDINKKCIENPYKIDSYIQINNEKIYPDDNNNPSFILHYIPNECTYVIDNNEVEIITLKRNTTKNIYITFDEKYSLPNDIEYIVTTTNITSTQQTYTKDSIQNPITIDLHTNASSIEISVTLKYTYNDVTTYKDLNSLIINIENFNDLVWYVGLDSNKGDYLTTGEIQEENLKTIDTNNLNNTLYGWHKINNNDFNINELFENNKNLLNITNTNTVFILPKGYYPALPMREESTNKLLTDNTFKRLSTQYRINGNIYYKWKINDNISENIYLISIITK